MRTLYLHIGLPKTGTTALQEFCAYNREELMKNGFSYPMFEYVYPDAASSRNGHFLIATCKGETGKRNYNLEKALFDKGLHMIEEAFLGCENVILSDEAIWHKTIKHRKELWNTLLEHSQNNNYQLKVIVYLRRQDELALSYISQKIKSGKNRLQEWSWEQYLENDSTVVMNYDIQLDKIEEVVGRENLIIRIYEKGQFKGEEGNLYSDFLDIFGLKLKDYKMEKEYRNVSLTYNGQEIKRIVNEVEAFDEENRKFIRNMAIKSLGNGVREEQYSFLSYEERKQFLDKYEEGNAYVARKYFNRKDGKLFEEVKVRNKKWNSNNPHMQEDVIRFFGEIILTQQKSIRQLKEEQVELKKQLEEIRRRKKKFRLFER